MTSGRKRALRLALVPTVGAALAIGTLGPVQASSHREAPLISQDPTADATDLYAFVSKDAPGKVNLIANYIPLEDPAGGPNFDRFGDDVLYRINIDNNGDAVPDVMYDFRFTTKVQNPNTFLYATGPVTSVYDANYNVRQTYSVWRTVNGNTKMMAEGLPTPPANVGPVSTPQYAKTAAQAVRVIKYGTKVFAGDRNDPFFVDLGSIFDLGQLRPFKPAYKPAPSAKPVRGRDAIAGFNVHTIALQVPQAYVTNNQQAVNSPTASNAVIGIWTTAYRQQTTVLSKDGSAPTTSGDWVQVSRLGNPLVNEVVIPLKDKDLFNSSQPAGDGQFANYVTNPELAGVITGLYGVKTPPAPRNDLVSIFLTGIAGLNQPKNVVASEQLRLNLGVKPTAKPNPLGLLGGDAQGYPNGRRLNDDVVDIGLRAVAGGTPFTPKFNVSPNNDLGDGVNHNEDNLLSSFPYVATPNQGYADNLGTAASDMTKPIQP